MIKFIIFLWYFSILFLIRKLKSFFNNDNKFINSSSRKQCYSHFIKRNYSFPSIISVDNYLAKNNFTLSISFDKRVFSIGYGEYDSHGHEDNEIFPNKQILNLTNIILIACGAFHSMCLNYDGNVFSFGCNNEGQLGIGGHELPQTPIPQKINIPPCKQVSCGRYFTMCLTEDNTLYSFGNNNYGELGLGNYKSYSSPQLIPDFNNIEYVVCGGYHSICNTYNNEFYSWGNNNSGQLGQGNYFEWCYNKPIQCLNWPDNIINIKCGYYHSLLLTLEGQVYSFGYNEYGQLGINEKHNSAINTPTLIKDIPEIQRIECGYHHSICVDINNNLWLFGDNTYGQLGLGDNEKRYKPILHPTLSDIIDISSGGNHTFVKTIDNKIYAFGSNNYSQLGIKTVKENQLKPIQVLEGQEEIWCSYIGKSRAKSARK